MHAVAGKQQSIVQGKFLDPAVQPHVILDTEGTVQDMAQRGLRQHMILGQSRQNLASQPPGATVADVQRMRSATAQNHCGKGRRRPFEFRVDDAHPVQPAIVGTHHLSRACGHADRRRSGIIAIDEGSHRQLGRDAPALGAADTVGDDRNHPVRRPLALGAFVDRAIILIGRTPARLARIAHSHHQTSYGPQSRSPASVRLARAHWEESATSGQAITSHGDVQ